MGNSVKQIKYTGRNKAAYRLKSSIKNAGYTQEKFAEEVNLSPDSIKKMCQGKTKIDGYVECFSNVLGVSADYLLGKSDDKSNGYGLRINNNSSDYHLLVWLSSIYSISLQGHFYYENFDGIEKIDITQSNFKDLVGFSFNNAACKVDMCGIVKEMIIDNYLIDGIKVTFSQMGFFVEQQLMFFESFVENCEWLFLNYFIGNNDFTPTTKAATPEYIKALFEKNGFKAEIATKEEAQRLMKEEKCDVIISDKSPF